VVGQHNADIADTLYLRYVAMATIFWLSIYGCTLAPPGEYDWVVHVWRRCSLMSNYFDHLLWAENWGAVPLWGGAAGSPPKTMWSGPSPTCMPSFILIRPTVWPQYTNVRDRQDRQTGQRNDSIGRTVSQTVA